MLFYYRKTKVQQIIGWTEFPASSNHRHYCWKWVCLIICFALSMKLLESVTYFHAMRVSNDKNLIFTSFISNFIMVKKRSFFDVVLWVFFNFFLQNVLTSFSKIINLLIPFCNFSLKNCWFLTILAYTKIGMHFAIFLNKISQRARLKQRLCLT
jgi:hypothetical protein